jgi:hypothetical protein
MIPIKNFTDDAAWLLGRALTEQDGLPETVCTETERDLRFAVPTALKDFYLAVGGQAAFMSSFQQFAEPQQWLICEEKLVFLEENQGVCYWATDAQGNVYQTTDLEAPEWHRAALDLPGFLHAMLYYQMAQGGYPFCGMIPADSFSCLQDVEDLVKEIGGRLVVDMPGLKVFAVAEQAILWYLHSDGEPDPGLFLSALDEQRFGALCEQWQFDDLG